MTKLDRKNLARWRNHPTDFIEEVLVVSVVRDFETGGDLI